MSVQHVSNLSEFTSIIRDSGNKLVVVDFTATWCGPCRAIAPHFDQLARRYEGRARFLKVDVDEAQDIARQSSVSSMPTFHFYRRGTRVAQFSGADPSKLDRTIEQHAPTSAEVSFSGEGNRLGSAIPTNTNPNPNPNSDSQSQQQQQGSSSMREAAALAAARRLQQIQQQTSDTTNGTTPTSSTTANANDSRLKVNESFANQMVNEMGFPRVRAEKALILTGNKSLEDAVEWCFEHADDADIDEPLQVVSGNNQQSNSTPPPPNVNSTTIQQQQPKLTIEEAKRRADELYAKARAKRESEEKRDAIEREKQRLKSGKEVTEARAKLQEAERKRAIEERRRQKREDLAERQRVRQMLEADKEARRQKFRMPSSSSSQQQQPQPQNPPNIPSNPNTMTTAAPSRVTGGKIQFRLPDGTRLESEFAAGQTMADVLSFLTMAKPELGARALKLSQQYPRKVFTPADYSISLADLKLLPRGALTVSYS